MDSNQVFIKTYELGEAINGSPVCIKMREAEEAAKRSPAIENGTERFMAHQNALQTIFSMGENLDGGVVDAIKLHRESMKAIQDELNSIPEYTQMQAARNEFQALISQVNQILGFIVQGDTEQATASCGGSCSSCAGCAGRE
ncbi:MAG: YlbF family regulator [Oscillospiraceae bacterium]|jgi:cell fate (sporulation/competence/biofilm development) regulator YlbF (YheA/YmcA/DUF963 family)|nr:YlbF family regulator [Oscillospiraceae bacterium]